MAALAVNSNSNHFIDLRLIAYDRGLHPVSGTVNPFHWIIFAKTGPDMLGTVYQLRGMPGNFRYPGPERNVDPSETDLKSHEVEIGRIPSGSLSDLEAEICKIAISKVEYGFNCQNWTEGVLVLMERKGWLDTTPAAIVAWFKDLEMSRR